MRNWRERMPPPSLTAGLLPPLPVRCCGGRDSGTWNTTATRVAAATTATVARTIRQFVAVRTRLPTKGAMTGTTPLTTITRVKPRAASRPLARSATTARPMTIPAAPVTPCRRRVAISTPMLGDSAATALATTASALPTSRGPRRPKRSESGPKTNCPRQAPARKVVMVHCTCEALAWRSAMIWGKAGRYRSIEIGAKAESRAS